MASEDVNEQGNPPFVRINVACKRAGVSRSTISRAMASGELTPIRKGTRMTFIRTSDLDNWIQGTTE